MVEVNAGAHGVHCSSQWREGKHFKKYQILTNTGIDADLKTYFKEVLQSLSPS